MRFCKRFSVPVNRGCKAGSICLVNAFSNSPMKSRNLSELRTDPDCLTFVNFLVAFLNSSSLSGIVASAFFEKLGTLPAAFKPLAAGAMISPTLKTDSIFRAALGFSALNSS